MVVYPQHVTSAQSHQRLKMLDHESTIASSLYTSAETLAVEQEKIFAGTWQLIGRADQLSEPGSYFTSMAGKEPVLVVRDRKNELRALSNVCRHRAGPVCRGAGIARSFQCRYHGWMYGLDGRLLATPEMDGARDFDKADFSLPRFELEAWHHLLFARAAGSGPPLAEVLSGIDEVLAPFDLSDYSWTVRKDWTIECNWKVYVDNYLEGYHIPIVHPALNEELDYERYEVETRRWFSIQHAPIRHPKRLRTGATSNEARFLWIFPNLMINVYSDNFSTNLIVPLGPDRTLTIFEWYFRDPDAERIVAETVEFSDEVQLEDIEICEDVQRGLQSSTYDRGRYSPKRENGVRHFHSLYRSAMGIASNVAVGEMDEIEGNRESAIRLKRRHGE